MSGSITLLIVLVILSLIVGGGIWYFMNKQMSFGYETTYGGGKKHMKHMKHSFFHHNKMNLVLALITSYIVYSIFIKY